tara:strand:- start:243 stop:623 length:381 start_codon:yes stop_codon:yes gene_type:complete
MRSGCESSLAANLTWMNRLSEKALWPHSCATTHMPVKTVPVTAAYASHSGANAALSGISVPAPTHASDWSTEIIAYIIDLAVLRLKQWAGTASRTCFLEGMSDASTNIALPCSPLRGMPSGSSERS